MKAARVHRFGDQLQVDEIPEPNPGGGDVIAQVQFVAVNPVDIWLTRGTVAGGRQQLPFIPGLEATVEAEGRRWLVQGGGHGTVTDGFYAERVAVSRDFLVPLPEGVDPAQAAALGVVGVTAWRLVDDIARVGQGDRVLVLGASGGVGSVLIQLVRARGAVVWGQTGSRDKAKLIIELGAERTVVAGAEDLVNAAADLQPTVVFDPLAGPFTPAAVELLRPRGRLALFGASAGPEFTLRATGLYRKEVSIVTYSGMSEPPERTRRALEEVLAELARGSVRVPIGEILPLAAAADAHRRILDRELTGKLLLRP
jgi:NADPH:quinone reductase